MSRLLLGKSAVLVSRYAIFNLHREKLSASASVERLALIGIASRFILNSLAMERILSSLHVASSVVNPNSKCQLGTIYASELTHLSLLAPL